MENKRKIDEYIPKAINSLSNNRKIVKDGKIASGFAGQIATFSVAVSMGSLLSAVAFFSEQKQASVERQELMNVIYEIITGEVSEIKKETDNKDPKLLSYVKKKYEEKEEKYEETNKNKILEYRRFQEDILNAAIAVKLAINFFHKIEKEDKMDE